MINKNIQRGIAFLLGAGLLAGCGGGSGGGNSGSNGGAPAGNDKPASAWLQITPDSLNLTAVEGSSVPFSITGKSSRTFSQKIDIKVLDTKGVITVGGALAQLSDLEYRVSLSVSDKLAPGTYSTRLEVFLCEDSPATCLRQVEGSPWYVPLNVVVQPWGTLTALNALPQLGAWNAYGGSRRTGYVPASFDPAKFTRRWLYRHSAADTSVDTSATAHDNGTAFVVTKEESVITLRAIDEASGKLLWQAQLPGYPVNSTGPTVANGKVLVGANPGMTGAPGNGKLLAYDQKTGKLLHETALNSSASLAGPVVVDGSVYVYGRVGSSNVFNLSRISVESGAIAWQTGLPLSNAHGVSADSQYLYDHHEGGLSMIRLADGGLVAGAVGMAACGPVGRPAVDPRGVVYNKCSAGMTTDRLIAYDGVNKKQVWMESTSTGTSVAISGTTLYAVKGRTLEARNLSDGKLQWSSTLKADEMPVAAPKHLLVTDNLAFISSDDRTVAVDFATRQVVWSFGRGGPLAISSTGVLYLPGNDTASMKGKEAALVAINLR